MSGKKKVTPVGKKGRSSKGSCPRPTEEKPPESPKKEIQWQDRTITGGWHKDSCDGQ